MRKKGQFVPLYNLHPFNIKRPSAPFLARMRTMRPPQTGCAESFVADTSSVAPACKDSFDNSDYFDHSEQLAEVILPFQGDTRSEAAMNLEAVLFLAREPLSVRRLAQLADLPEGTKVRTILQQLNERYDHQPCAFRIVEVAGGYQLRTRPEFAPWLARMQEVPSTIRLSAPVMETLAVIAYRQPVGRAEIEQIRGVQCGELIRQLLDRDLVRIVGRSEELGRPFFYGTTRYFLQVFGLGSLNELPNQLQKKTIS